MNILDIKLNFVLNRFLNLKNIKYMSRTYKTKLKIQGLIRHKLKSLGHIRHKIENSRTYYTQIEKFKDLLEKF